MTGVTSGLGSESHCTAPSPFPLQAACSSGTAASRRWLGSLRCGLKGSCPRNGRCAHSESRLETNKKKPVYSGAETHGMLGTAAQSLGLPSAEVVRVQVVAKIELDKVSVRNHLSATHLKDMT